MSDDLEKPCHQELSGIEGPLARKLKEQADRIRELEAALREIRAMHYEDGVNDLEERDDRTYCIVCDALEGEDER